MCYYNGVRVSRAEFIRLKNLEKELKLIQRPMQSGFDYSDWPIIKPMGTTDWEIKMAHWEFVPYWIKSAEALAESRKKFATLNATSERLLESKMFKEAALKRRCLVLSSGFYEWRHYKPEGAKKELTYPYYITLASEHEPPLFYMAGIYQPSVDFITGEVIDTFAIITTKANELMTDIHNTKKRMPTILPQALAEEWISPNLSEERLKEIAAFQYNSEEMIAWTVAKDFRHALNPTEEFDYSELPPILV